MKIKEKENEIKKTGEEIESPEDNTKEKKTRRQR